MQEIKTENLQVFHGRMRRADDCYAQTIVIYLLEILRGTTQISRKHSHAFGHRELSRDKMNSRDG